MVTVPVVRLEAKLPYGHERREVEILPPASVSFDPGFAAFSTDQAAGSLRARVVVRGHRAGEFRIRPEAPEGFRAEPGEASVRIGRAGEEVRLDFALIPGAAPAGRYLLRASVFDESGTALPAMEIQRIAHRDLPLRYLVRPAGLRIAVISLSVPEGIRVGYVRGAGDEVPAAIEALGAALVFLDEASLLRGDLSRFDAIVTGTRAYAIRPDLIRANRRLLDYAAAGGHLVVLYNTQELVPDEHAPFPGVLPRRAEEVSEEDSQVTILAPGHPLLNWPNRIGPADFEGWVEQRGSKFWSGWDPAYTPLFETADADQAPQRGGALTAEVGTGRYTYFAYALHRQLPEAVPGAFRLLANLIAASRRPR